MYRCSSFVIGGGKRPHSTPLPERQHGIAIRPAQFRCRLDQYAEDHSAIIVGELDDPSLGDEPAQFDQMPRALAPLHLPVAGLMPRLPRLKTVVSGRRPSQRRLVHGQCGCQRLRVALERTQHPACATPPS